LTLRTVASYFGNVLPAPDAFREYGLAQVVGQTQSGGKSPNPIQHLSMVPSLRSSEGQRTFMEQLAVIERIIASIARRHCMAPDERDDFASWVRLRLIENDYAILRKFQGISSMSTYLTVVITNLHRDYRIREWGRWRPSVAAKRLGELAVALEMLLYRDGHTLTQAIQVLRSRRGAAIDERELTRIAAQLPVRTRTRPADSAELDSAPAPQRADTELLLAEFEDEWDDARTALTRALAGMPPEDQLIVRLRYWEGTTVANIARTLGLDQKRLYRRIEQLLATLRVQLESQGIGREVIEHFFSAALP